MIYIFCYFAVGAVIIMLSWREVVEYLNEDDTKSNILNSPVLIILQDRNLIKPIIFIVLVIIWVPYLFALIKGWVRDIRVRWAISKVNRVLKKHNIKKRVSLNGRDINFD